MIKDLENIAAEFRARHNALTEEMDALNKQWAGVLEDHGIDQGIWVGSKSSLMFDEPSIRYYVVEIHCESAGRALLKGNRLKKNGDLRTHYIPSWSVELNLFDCEVSDPPPEWADRENRRKERMNKHRENLIKRGFDVVDD